MKRRNTNNMKKIIYSLITIWFLCWSSPIKAQAIFDIESGLVSTGYNDVRIPGDNGTLFSLKDDLKPKSKLFYRLRASYTIKSRHTISVLYAPLEIKSEGSVAKDISFQGAVFPANTKLYGTYKFNSYRLTYRYDIVQKPKFEFGLGLTAKIRDARISLSFTSQPDEKTNVGFVPIINFRLLWKMDDKFGILMDGDALVGKQGRAEDVLIAATYKFSDNIGFRAGYRILEGGSDSDKVYGFALFHYALLGFTISL
jgi:hypothetical protein